MTPRAAAFMTKLTRHNAMEWAMIRHIRAQGWPPPAAELAAHHALEEAMLRDMAAMTDAELGAAIDAYDATPGALL